MIKLPEPRNQRMVLGGGDVKIAVQQWGKANGFPILFIHAFSQSHLAWWQQIAGRLSLQFNLTTFDNRGHGNSAKPEGIEPYTNGDLYADDIKAVISTCKLKRPIIVAWSIGGVILGDYLAKYGDQNVSGIVYLGAAHQLGIEPGYVGSAFAEKAVGMLSNDLATNVAATIAVGEQVTAKSTDPSTFTFIIATNMVVPTHVRAGMLRRKVDHITNTLPKVLVPSRFIHGSKDQIVLLASSEAAAAASPNSKLIILDGVGHAPHIEAAEALATELEHLVSELGEGEG